MSDQVEEKSVSASEVKAGVKLTTGHPVTLIVDGMHGKEPEKKDEPAKAPPGK